MSINEVSKKLNIRWLLMAYDIAIFLLVVFFMVSAYGIHPEDITEFVETVIATLACLLFCRIMGNVYHMVIRYGGVGVYMRLFATDLTALLFYFPLKYVFGLRNMESKTWLIVIMLNLLGAVGIRLMYRYCYRYGVRKDKKGEFLRWLLVLFAGETVIKERRNKNKRIRVAVLGAGKINNVKLRGASVDLSYLQQDSAAYKYNNAKAHWQMLNHNNNGYLYGDGFNAVGTLHISGSLSKDLAVGITPRFSWDKDEHGDASLVEGYAKTHLGVWGITAGRQPMSWGVGRAGQLAFGSNATPQTAIKLNLLEPHTFDNGALKFLGKANVNVFASRLEGNRVASSASALEKDHAAFVGVRVDIMPTDAFTIGLERMSMLKKFNKHWLLGDNADDAEKDNWNDIAGLDFKYRFPGVQVYASLYGEDQAHAFPCENAYNIGMYFPQLVPDGSWDLRVEAAKTNDAWYGHWVLKNGWTYKDAILGDWLGADAKRVYAEVNHYMADGGKLGLSYTWADMQPTAQHDGRLQEVELSYSKSLQKDLLLHTAVGYGKLGDDTSKLVAVGLSWEY